MRLLRIIAIATSLFVGVLCAAEPPQGCRVQAVPFDGWKAQQISNSWVTITVVPNLGGRVMQVTFGGHAYLFVNPKLKGQYFPPTPDKWFNYGGDKLWPLPEGTEDDQHWPGPVADVLDDGQYAFSVLSTGEDCRVRLEGPADLKTGLQYSREVTLHAGSPEITFEATMKNASQRPIRWSMQSVTQYNTSAPDTQARFNPKFFAFTGANPDSAYLGGYTLRTGEAEDPAMAVKDGVFTLHYTPFQREVWVDSPSGWLAVLDGSSGFAMVERFPHERQEYPGKASVIFYTNGTALAFDPSGLPYLNPPVPDSVSYYMEAEVNSPMVALEPQQTYTLRTTWSPTRTEGPIAGIAEAGVINVPLAAAWNSNQLLLTGSFGVFHSGTLIAKFLDESGAIRETRTLGSVSPLEILRLHELLVPPSGAAKVILSVLTDGAEHRALAQADIAPKRP